MNLTKGQRTQLRRKYNQAVKAGKDQFEFEGRTMLVAYAKYVLEYLDKLPLPPKKPPKPASDFSERLVKSLLSVFTDAYKLHAQGVTETELLIQHDIFAAASDHHKTIKDGHRKALLAAVAAVDDGVPLPLARAYLEVQLRNKCNELNN